MKLIMLSLTLLVTWASSTSFYRPSHSAPFHVSVLAERLVFPTIADYRKVVDQPNAEMLPGIIKNISPIKAVKI